MRPAVPLMTVERAGAALALLLAILIPLGLLWPREIASADSATPLVATPLAIFEASGPEQALEAPLFNPLRTVPIAGPSGEGVADQASPNGPPSVVGLITGRKTGGVALLRSAGGETIVARAGEVVDGWTVGSISASAVTIRKGSDERQIGLDYSNHDSAAGPGSASPSQ